MHLVRLSETDSNAIAAIEVQNVMVDFEFIVCICAFLGHTC
jgi:hypothetical protein